MPKKTPQQIAEEARKKAEKEAKKKTEEQKKLFDINDLIKQLNGMFSDPSMFIQTTAAVNKVENALVNFRNNDAIIVEQFQKFMDMARDEASKQIMQSIDPLKYRESFTLYSRGSNDTLKPIKIGKDAFGMVFPGLHKHVFYNPQYNLLKVEDALFDPNKNDLGATEFVNKVQAEMVEYEKRINNAAAGRLRDLYWYGPVFRIEDGLPGGLSDEQFTITFQTNAIKFESLVRADQTAILQGLANDYQKIVNEKMNKLTELNEKNYKKIETLTGDVEKIKLFNMEMSEKYKDFTGKVLQKVGVLPEDYDVKNKKQDEFFTDVDISVVKYNFNQAAKGAQIQNLEQSIFDLSDAQSLLSNQLATEQKQNNELRKLFKKKEDTIFKLEQTRKSQEDTIADLNRMLSLEQLDKQTQIDKKNTEISRLKNENVSMSHERDEALKEISMSKLDSLNKSFSPFIERSQRYSQKGMDADKLESILNLNGGLSKIVGVSDGNDGSIKLHVTSDESQLRNLQAVRKERILELKNVKTPEEREKIWGSIKSINAMIRGASRSIFKTYQQDMDKVIDFAGEITAARNAMQTMLDTSMSMAPENRDTTQEFKWEAEIRNFPISRQNVKTVIQKLVVQSNAVNNIGRLFQNDEVEEVKLERSYLQPNEKLLQTVEVQSINPKVDRASGKATDTTFAISGQPHIFEAINTSKVNLKRSYLQPNEKLLQTVEVSFANDNNFFIDREYEAGKAETGAGKKIIVKKEKTKMPGDRLGITNIVLGSSFLSGARALLLPNGSLFKMKN